MLLLSVFAVAALGMLGAFLAYCVIRFSLPDPQGAIWALLAWAATLSGTSALIIQMVVHWQSIG